jgi:Protein of unknown function (DUF1570)
MFCCSWIIGLAFLGQVPSPSSGLDQTAKLKTMARAIETHETRELDALASELAGKGDARAAAEVRELASGGLRGDASRIVPLPELVPGRVKGLASIAGGSAKNVGKASRDAWRTRVEDVRRKSAVEYLGLAKQAAAANPAHYALAGLALREVLKRHPDEPEARRLLGYVPYEGGWARPFAVRQLKSGLVDHPVFGWVPSDWVSHLDRGELPAPSVRVQDKVRWLPALQADQLRANWNNPWKITTEHFKIQADVPLSEAIGFARRLEAFYDLFFALMADVVGQNLPLARRFRSPSLTAEAAYRPHQVDYFASKEEYVDHLRPTVGEGIHKSLGYYNPPKSGRDNRATAYFFRDIGGQLSVTDTLYHEVSHQLLFESAGPNRYTQNAGNYWVFEGLGCYFETVLQQTDGSLEVGGLVGARIAEARRTFANGRFLSLEPFIRLDQNGFNREDRIYVDYQQAMALALFLMQYDDALYRDSFLDYVREAYRGRIKTTTGRSLEDRLGQPLDVIEAQFRRFLTDGEFRPHR